MNMFKYNGNGSTAVNQNDPLAQGVVGKQAHVANFGVAGYDPNRTIMSSNYNPSNTSVKETWLPYESDIIRMMDYYDDFVDQEYFFTVEASITNPRHKIKRKGGYKWVMVDPVGELHNGNSRRIGQICTYMSISRYASFVAWSKESESIEEAKMDIDILRAELVNDMMIRVPAMVSYITTVNESSKLYGDCTKATFDQIEPTDVLDIGIFKFLKNTMMKNVNYSPRGIEVLVDNPTFDKILELYSQLNIWGNGGPSSKILNAFENDLQMFSINGITYKVNMLIEEIPQGSIDPVTGFTNSLTNVSFAVARGGKFGYKAMLSDSDIINAMVTKEGNIIPYDIFDEVRATAYKFPFGVRVVDPTLSVIYYFASTEEYPCTFTQNMDSFYSAIGMRQTTRYQRFANDPADGLSPELAFATPTIAYSAGTLFMSSLVSWKDTDKDTQAQTEPMVYKEDMMLLTNSYEFRLVNPTDGQIIGSAMLNYDNTSDNRTAMSSLMNIAPGTYDAVIAHNQLGMGNEVSCNGDTFTAMQTQVVIDVTGSVTLVEALTSPLSNVVNNAQEAEPLNQEEMAKQSESTLRNAFNKLSGITGGNDGEQK